MTVDIFLFIQAHPTVVVKWDGWIPNYPHERACWLGGNVKRVRTRSIAGKQNTGGIRFGPLADWAGFHLRMAQAASFQAFSKLSNDVGERPGRFATLLLIDQNPGIGQTALSRANGRDKSSLTPVLENLVRRGLVRRTQARDDKRSYRLALTPAGKRTLSKLVVCAREHDRNLDELIGKRNKAKFVATLKRIAAQIGS